MSVTFSFFTDPLAQHAVRYAASLRTLPARQRYGAAFAFGIIAALALPPYDLFPLLWVSFPALVFLLQGSPDKKTIFLTGWSFSFSLFLLGLYWIAVAMFVDIHQFWWAVPFAVAGLPAFLGLFYGTACLLAAWLGRGTVMALSLAFSWFVADLARSFVLTGFPWNLEAYAWDKVLPMLQITSIIGTHGLTLVTLLAAILAASWVEDYHKERRLAMLAHLLLIGFALWGGARLLNAPAASADHGARLRIVQPNIDQTEKWRGGKADEHFQRLLDLSSAASRQPIQAVIWPETASTFFLAEDATHRFEVADHVPKGGVILTGVIRREADGEGHAHYYNSLLGIDRKGAIVTQYDKFHLVPFGEYFPMRRWIPFGIQVLVGVDFTPGPGPQTLSLPGLPSFSPLICYEAIFPGAVTDPAHRPDFLVSITNDGWYGKTAGPYQHFASVRVRAIEEGLPLARAANTGISGLIDPYGRVRMHMGLDIAGVIDGNLPDPLPPTLFSQYKHWPVGIMLLGLGMLIGIKRQRT